MGCDLTFSHWEAYDFLDVRRIYSQFPTHPCSQIVSDEKTKSFAAIILLVFSENSSGDEQTGCNCLVVSVLEVVMMMILSQGPPGRSANGMMMCMTKMTTKHDAIALV